ncbi:UNVERIFIED_CONTAM: hypothetical protein GTU68_053480 [Idotea baltica]|nr:hypothetical protein [Idotea baltica]
MRALAQAEDIVYDALISAEILALVNPDAKLHFAGKRGGKPSSAQIDISALLVKLAKTGSRVCRLKGGDPFVFGRGGEEALALRAENIPFRVVPGVTAGIGGLAYAGIPVTHRHVNTAVTFLTGHDASGDTPYGVDWAALSKSSPVIVIYMPMKHLGEIADRLMKEGRSPDEPVALVTNASLPNQTVLSSTLASVESDAPKRSRHQITDDHGDPANRSLWPSS